MVNHSRNRNQRHRRDTNRGRGSSEIEQLCSDIVFEPPVGESLSPDLFNQLAESAAKIVAKNGKKNKTSQLRRFYDELLRWEERVNDGDTSDADARLSEYLPFIMMMNAKAAYAKGRDLVDESFVALLRTCLKNGAKSPRALRHCRLFLEAFMGFYKLHGQD